MSMTSSLTRSIFFPMRKCAKGWKITPIGQLIPSFMQRGNFLAALTSSKNWRRKVHWQTNCLHETHTDRELDAQKRRCAKECFTWLNSSGHWMKVYGSYVVATRQVIRELRPHWAATISYKIYQNIIQHYTTTFHSDETLFWNSFSHDVLWRMS